MKTIDQEFYRTLGANLNKARLDKGLTLKDISAKSGIPRSSISQYLLGNVRLKHELFDRLCQAMDICPEFEVKIDF